MNNDEIKELIIGLKASKTVSEMKSMSFSIGQMLFLFENLSNRNILDDCIYEIRKGYKETKDLMKEQGK